MRLEYHPSTTTDLNRAIAFYESLRPGLGDDCRAEIYAAIEQIIELPRRFPIVQGNIRRCFVTRFPLSVLFRYLESEARIRILVIRHHRQRPGFGLRRR